MKSIDGILDPLIFFFFSFYFYVFFFQVQESKMKSIDGILDPLIQSLSTFENATDLTHRIDEWSFFFPENKKRIHFFLKKKKK